MIDIYFACAWVLFLALAVHRYLAGRSRPRHTWGELSSTDVARAAARGPYRSPAKRRERPPAAPSHHPGRRLDS